MSSLLTTNSKVHANASLQLRREPTVWVDAIVLVLGVSAEAVTETEAKLADDSFEADMVFVRVVRYVVWRFCEGQD